MHQETEMNIKINLIVVCKEEETELFDDWTEELKNSSFSTFNNLEICTIQITQNKSELQELIDLMTKLRSIDIILIINLLLPYEIITDEINKISNTENEIIKEFAQIPLLLKPQNSSFLHCSCRKKTFIFCVTDDKSNILTIVQKTANAMISAAYLLQQVYAKCNIFNHPHKVEDWKNPHKQSLSEKKEKKIITDLPKPLDIRINKTDTHIPKKLELNKEEALKLMNNVINHNQCIETEEVNIKDAFGRILFEEAKCNSNVPPFTAATKYGYAITENTETNKREDRDEVDAKLILQNKIISSSNKTAKWVNKGEFFSNVTIIPVENVKDVRMLTKRPLHAVEGLGSEIEKNKVIINARKRIGSTEIAFLTACGYNKVRVLKKLSIGVLTIGNKLQEPAESLKAEHSYDSNRAILISLLKENCFNFFEHQDFGIVIKDLTLIAQKIEAALKTVDLLVITGYSSNTNYKDILVKHFKATLYFENVNIKPGKSTVFASSNFEGKTKYILWLPANPVSVFITAHLFLLPLIKSMHHIPYVEPTKVMAAIKQNLLLHSRPRYVFATISWSANSSFATVTCKEKSSISKKLSDIKNANALLQLPAKTSKINKLESPSFVPAILIKFPISNERNQIKTENMFEEYIELR